MAGMFYSLKEVAAKLSRTEEQIKELVKEGKLREFRDGPNLLFKVDEVEALMSDTSVMAATEVPAEAEPLIEEESIMAPTEPPAEAAPVIEEESIMAPTEPPAEAAPVIEEEEISLAPEPGESAGGQEPTREQGDETFMSGDGVSVLGETDMDYQLAEDTMGETKAASTGGVLGDDMPSETKAASGESSLEEIDEDVNLDTFGSGSGLLDLSLQADDTSLGGILDEIYTAEGEEGQAGEEPQEASAMEVAAEAEEMLTEEAGVEPAPRIEGPAVVHAYVEAQPDTLSNAFGTMLFLPLAVVFYTTVVVILGSRGVMPSILTSIQGMIWYIMGGVAVAAGLIVGVAFMMGGQGASAGKPKAAKVKKAKPPKAKKEKKPKKEKKSRKEKKAKR